jgi:hypothetical protein
MKQTIDCRKVNENIVVVRVSERKWRSGIAAMAAKLREAAKP